MAEPVFSNKPSTGNRDEHYYFVFDIIADSPPVTKLAGSLPPGLQLSDNIDNYHPVISGTPTALGTYNFTLVAVTAEGFVKQDFIIVIKNFKLFTGIYLEA